MNQTITTSKGYVYYTGGFIVDVGDTVILPSEWINKDGDYTYTDTVAKLGGSYSGDVKTILGIAARVRATRRKCKYDGDFASYSADDATILMLIQNAENLTIDGVTYVKKTSWIRQ